MQHDVDIEQFGALALHVMSHGVVAAVGSRVRVDVVRPVGTGHHRWRRAPALGGGDGEVDADRGVGGALHSEGLGIVHLQSDPAQARVQLNGLGDGSVREAH